MSRHLLTLNAVLIGVSIGLIVYIGWQLVAPRRAESPTRRTTAAATPPPAVPAPPDSGAGSAVIATRNLFSPDRTEAPVAGTQSAALANIPKPSLFGVVLKDGAPIAYLEDPITKRVAGYRVGDAVAGGTLQAISSDRVVLVRPEGQVDVRLHDPSRPRPATPPVAGQPEGAPGMPGTPRPPFPPQPGQQAPFPGVTPPPAVVQPQPPVTGALPDQQVVPPGRRPLPPNLLRRVPQGSADVPAR